MPIYTDRPALDVAIFLYPKYIYIFRELKEYKVHSISFRVHFAAKGW